MVYVFLGKIGHTLTMGDPDAERRVLHALEHDGRALQDLHGGEAGLEAAGPVVDEARLQLVGNAPPRHPTEQRHELAAVANSEAESVGPVIEALELFPDLLVEPYARRPSLR